jgi:rhodanese-related sulfurtransferase
VASHPANVVIQYRENKLMPKEVGLEEMRRLVEEVGQVVEVLPPREYAEEHLPRAVNIPLKTLNEATAARLDKHRPVVVYCWDYF